MCGAGHCHVRGRGRVLRGRGDPAAQRGHGLQPAGVTRGVVEVGVTSDHGSVAQTVRLGLLHVGHAEGANCPLPLLSAENIARAAEQ